MAMMIIRARDDPRVLAFIPYKRKHNEITFFEAKINEASDDDDIRFIRCLLRNRFNRIIESIGIQIDDYPELIPSLDDDELGDIQFKELPLEDAARDAYEDNDLFNEYYNKLCVRDGYDWLCTRSLEVTGASRKRSF